MNSDKTVIINSIKDYLKFKSDSEFATFLGVSRATLSAWKTRNTIDYDLIAEKCPQINMNFVVTGKGSISKEEINTTISIRNVDKTDLDVKTLRKKAGLTEVELAKQIKVPVTRVHNWENGDTAPNPEDYKKLKAFFEKTGEVVGAVNESLWPYNKTTKLLPLLDGQDAFNTNSKEHVDNSYNVPIFKGLADFLIKVNGTSMSPTYNNGDIVACRIIPKNGFIQWNKVYAIDTDQGVLIKRIRKSDKEGFVICESDNQSYEPFELSITDQINTIATVVGVIRLE